MLQHRTTGVGRRRKMHGLIPNYDRDARLASTLTCAGLEKCCRGGGAGERKETLRPHPIRIKMGAGFITGCGGV